MEPTTTDTKETQVPRGLPISGAILLILGLVAQPLIDATATEEQLARNVLLSAIPFILIFIAIVIFYMTLVWFAASQLNERVPNRTYRPIELGLMGGIVLGIFFMFQPWIFALFRIGFFVLLAATLGYILWSHVRPKVETESAELTGLSIADFERRESGEINE
ncbi:MAG: hypothetical protein R3300_13290 [Candidatus Promineifilaceae bacterium]|nr:hypothetical protein [Candidatus Promineifilaceae bacterium]